MIFFLFTIISIVKNPVSVSHMAVGVCSGSCGMVFSALLNIVSIWSFFFLGSHDSDPYVIIGNIMVSTSSHMAAIFIAFHSLFPVSARISWVAARIFPFRAIIWSVQGDLRFFSWSAFYHFTFCRPTWCSYAWYG